MKKHILAIAVLSLAFSGTILADSGVNFAIATETNILTQESINSLLRNMYQDQNAAFSTSAEIIAYGKNNTIAQAFADKIKTESAVRLSRDAVDVAHYKFQTKVTTGIYTCVAVFATGMAVIAFIEWCNHFRKNCVTTALEIERIKIKIAEERAKLIALEKNQTAFA